MTIEEALFDYLSNHAGLSALVSKKIYPLTIPQSTILPAVTYKKIAVDRPRSAVCGHHGIINTTLQIKVHAKTKASESAITQQIHNALINYSGLMGDVRTQGCFCLYEEDDYDEEALEYYNLIDYQITHQ